MNIGLAIVELIILCLAVLVLHRLSQHFGLTLLLSLVITLTILTQSTAESYSYIQVSDSLFIVLGPAIAVPTILLAVLVLYVADGTFVARQAIYGIIAATLFSLVVLQVSRVHLGMPGGGNFLGITADDPALAFGLSSYLASLGAFIADLYIIVIVYQGLTNRVKTPQWLNIGGAFFAALAIDTILFNVLLLGFYRGFVVELADDLLSKLVVAVVVWPLAAVYITQIAPKFANPINLNRPRPTFQLLFGSVGQMQVALNQSQAALAESEERYRQLAENIREVFILATPDASEILYLSPAFEDVWGIPVGQAYNDPGVKNRLIIEEDRDGVLAALKRSPTDPFNIEYRIRRPDGTVRWVHERSFPVTDEEGNVYRIAGIAEDITGRKEAEQQRVDLAVERQNVQFLRNFVGDASHDLKNPITTIKTQIYLLQQQPDAENRGTRIDAIYEQTTRLEKLIDDMLMLSELDHKIELEMTSIDLNSLVSRVGEAAKPLAEANQQSLIIQADGPLPPILANDRELFRALNNLVENAMYYTPRGGEIRVGTQSSSQRVQVTIADTGAGIKSADLPHIFERFYRARESLHQSMKGTGLGLAIVKTVVDKHRGSVNVESTEGQGTTFTLSLPIPPDTIPRR